MLQQTIGGEFLGGQGKAIADQASQWTKRESMLPFPLMATASGKDEDNTYGQGIGGERKGEYGKDKLQVK
jgi:hypothetical protein